MSYTMSVTVPDEPTAAEERVRAALADEGFGILSEIDVRAKLQEKVGEDVGTYRILGACNPALAHQGISADRDLGALLPCNVLIRDGADGGTEVVAADPEAMLGVADDAALTDLARDAKARIARALETLVG